MKRRTLKGLKRCERLPSKPSFIPTINHRGSRREGLLYERKVADRLRDMYGDERVIHNPWIKYIDTRGAGWCCPDILLLPQGGEPLILAECKLTTTPKAFRQLKNFYVPVVKMLWPEHTIRSIQIAYNLSRDWDGPMMNLENLYDESLPERVTLNWRDL